MTKPVVSVADDEKKKYRATPRHGFLPSKNHQELPADSSDRSDNESASVFSQVVEELVGDSKIDAERSKADAERHKNL